MGNVVHLMEAGTGTGLHVLEGGHLPAALGGCKLLCIEVNTPLLANAQWHRECPTHLVMRQMPRQLLGKQPEEFQVLYLRTLQPAQWVIKICPVGRTVDFPTDAC